MVILTARGTAEVLKVLAGLVEDEFVPTWIMLVTFGPLVIGWMHRKSREYMSRIITGKGLTE